MVIKLKFKNFAEISPLEVQDSIMFHIKDPHIFFISAEYLKDLDKNYWTLTSKLMKQMEDTVATRSIMTAAEATSDGILNALIGTFVINIVFQGAMSYLVSFINSL